MIGRAVCLVLILLIPSVAVADFTGPVISVLDGDTIEVLHNTHPARVRLSGIDCPENGQAFGTRAKQAASELVFGRVPSYSEVGRGGGSWTKPWRRFQV